MSVSKNARWRADCLQELCLWRNPCWAKNVGKSDVFSPFFPPEEIISSLYKLLVTLQQWSPLWKSWLSGLHSGVSSTLPLCEGWECVGISGKRCLKWVLPFLFTSWVSFLSLLGAPEWLKSWRERCVEDRAVWERSHSATLLHMNNKIVK